MTDLLEAMEVELARVLRGIDRAAMLAQQLRGSAESASFARQERILEATERVLKVRQAVLASGVQLPPLRVLEDRAEEPCLLAPRERETWTVQEIAELAGVHRATVSRWLWAMAGPVGEKWRAVRAKGRPALFSGEEVDAILRAGGQGPAGPAAP